MSVSLAAQDPDGEAITYALVGSAPEWLKLEGALVTLSPRVGHEGEYTVGLSAADASGENTSAVLRITVTAFHNRAPRLAEQAPLTMKEGDRRTIVVEGADANGDALTFAFKAAPPSFATLEGRALSLAPSFDDAGSYEIVLTATDPGGLAAETVVPVVVEEQNRAPVMDAIEAVSMDEGDARELTLAASDPDGDEVAFELVEGPDFVSLAEHVLTLSPSFTHAGSHTVKLRVRDTHDLASDLALTLTVTNTDRAPVMKPVAGQFVAEGGQLGVALEASDEDGDEISFQLAAGAPTWTRISTGSATLELFPGLDDEGTHTFGVQATAGGLRDTTLVSVTVTRTNRPPELARVELVELAENETRDIELIATDADGGDPALELLDSPAFAQLSGSTLVLRPGYEDAGRHTVIVRATDSDGAQVEQRMAVRVANADRAPVWVPIAPVTLDENDRANLPLEAGDPDEEPVTFQMGPDAPAWASLEGSTLVLAPDYAAAGEVVLTVLAISGEESTPLSVTVTVSDVNRPPELQPLSDVTLTGAEAHVVTLNGSDPDGDELAWGVAGLPEWAVFDPSARTISFEPAANESSNTSIEVTVTDPAGASAARSFSVSVNSLQTAPELAELEMRVEGLPVSAGATLSDPPVLAAKASDGQGNQMRLEVELRRETEDFIGQATHAGEELGAPGTLSLTLPPLPSGTYKWQIRAIDSTDRASPWTFFNEGEAAFVLSPEALAGGLVIEGGDFTNQPVVSLRLEATASTGATLATVQLSEDGVTYGQEYPFATSLRHVLSAGDGARNLYARVADTFGNVGIFHDSVVLDTTAPSGTLELNKAESSASPLSYTSAREVRLHLDFADATSGLAEACVSNYGPLFESTDCQPFATESAWTLPEWDALHAVHVLVRDRAGNETIVSDAIILDTMPPFVALAIDDEDTFSNSGFVTVNVAGTDDSGLEEICLSNEASVFAAEDCHGIHSWSVQWSFPEPDGTKTVHLRVKDGAGNYAFASATTTVDTTPPQVTSLSIEGVTEAQGWAHSNDFPLSLSLSSSDALSGVTEMRFSNDGVTWSEFQPAGATREAWNPGEHDGLKSLCVQVRDAAGNLSESLCREYIHDRTPPEIPSYGDQPAMALKNDDAYTTTRMVPVVFNGVTDRTSNLCWVEFLNEGATSGTRQPYTNPMEWELSAGSGQKSVTARVSDCAGNVASLTDTITYDADALAPSLTIVPSPATRLASVTLNYAIPLTSTSGDVVSVCRSEASASGPWSCGLPIPEAPGATTSTSWDIPQPDGTKTLYLMVETESGQVATTSASVVLDTAAPDLVSISINDGATYANKPQVMVAMNVAGENTSPLTTYCVGESAAALSCSTGWPANGRFTHTFASTVNETKNLVVKVLDQAGNESQARTTSIVLDTQLPTVSGMKLNGRNSTYSTPVFTNTRSVTADLVSPADTLSGLSTVEFSTDYSNWDLRPYVGDSYTSVDLGTTDGRKTLYVRLTDKAGNARVAQVYAVLDTTLPSGAVTLEGVVLSGTKYTKTPSAVSMALTLTDTNRSAYYCVSGLATKPAWNDACFVSTSGLFSHGVATVTRSLPSTTDGAKTVYVYFRDMANNVSVAANDTIAVDTTGPSLGAFASEQTVAGHRQVSAQWTAASDAGAGLSGYRLGWSYASEGPWRWQDVPAGKLFDTIAPVSNETYVYLKLEAVDRLGNTSTSTPFWRQPRFPFELLQRGPTTETFADLVRLTNSTHVAVGTRGLAMKTTDGCLTWSRRDPGVDVDLNAAAFKDASRGVAVGAGGTVSVTKDGGYSWAPVQPNASFTYALNDVAYVYSDASKDYFIAVGDRGVFRGALSAYDGTDTWTAVTLPTEIAASTNFSAVAACPVPHCTGNTIIAVGNEGARMRSTDGGASFSALTVGTKEGLDVAWLPGTSTFYVADGAYNLFRSTNGGATFATFASTELSANYHAVTRLLPHAGGLLAAARPSSGNYAYVLSYDTSGAGSRTFVDYTRLNGLTTTGSTSLLTVGATGNVYTGAFGGTYWSFTSRSSGATSTVAGSSLSANHVWVAGTSFGVGRAPRATGATFVDTRKSGFYPHAIHALSDTQAFVAGYAYSGGYLARMYRADVAGDDIILTDVSGTEISAQQSELRGLHCADASYCLAVGRDVVNRYQNGAWSQRFFNEGWATLEDVVTWYDGTTRKAIAVGWSGKLVQIVNNNLPTELATPTLYSLYGIARNAATNTLVAVGSASTIVRSSDGGATWANVTDRPLSVPLRDVAHAGGGTWYAVGSGGIVLKSTDDGSSWVALATGSSMSLQSVAAAGTTPGEIWAVGSSGTVLHSPYGGW